MLQQDDDYNQQPSAPNDPPLFHGARGVAVKILTRIEQSDAYLDKLLHRELSSSELGDADRRLLNEIATGVLRWQGKLDWVLTGFYHGEFSRCIPVVRNALRVALYQILFLDRIPHSAAVNESVEIVKRIKGNKSASVVNGVLRSIIRRLNAISYPERTDDVPRYLSIMYSHPLWLVRRWTARYGNEETEALLEANNRRPKLALRVNPLRSGVMDVLSALAARGLSPRQSIYVPNMAIVEGLPGIGSDPLFTGGMVTVQDEGAALACLLAGARPGMRAIDLCAAPGGKSTALAEAMQGEGEIVSVDMYESKLPQIRTAIERLGFAEMIRMQAGDARTIDLDPADIVLADVPCSGLGVLMKKPDIKWKRTPEDIDALVQLQAAILHNAARLVKPGGVLVYATCTIEPAENEEMVERFLREHPEFELEDAAAYLPPEVVENGFLMTLPHRHGMDGMFGARMRRR